jgi:hypothetical protein
MTPKGITCRARRIAAILGTCILALFVSTAAYGAQAATRTVPAGERKRFIALLYRGELRLAMIPRERREAYFGLFLTIVRSRGALLPEDAIPPSCLKEGGEGLTSFRRRACTGAIGLLYQYNDKRATKVIEPLLTSDIHCSSAAGVYVALVGKTGMPRVCAILDWGNAPQCLKVFELIQKHPTRGGAEALKKFIGARRRFKTWEPLVTKAKALLAEIEKPRAEPKAKEADGLPAPKSTSPAPPAGGTSSTGARQEEPSREAKVVRNKKAEATRLLDDYFSLGDVREPTVEEARRVAELIKQLGSNDYETREKALRKIVKSGRVALKQLRKASESPDLEVAGRAKQAVSRIGTGPAPKLVDALRRIGDPALIVIRGRMDEILSAARDGEELKVAQEGRHEDKTQSAGRTVARRKLRHLYALHNSVLGVANVQTKAVAKQAEPTNQTEGRKRDNVRQTVTLGAGKESAVKERQIFLIQRRRVYVAAVMVTEVRAHRSVARLLDGTGRVVAGDTANTAVLDAVGPVGCLRKRAVVGELR